MRRFLTHLSVASLFLVSLLATGASATLAAPGNGAYPSHVNDCGYVAEYDYTFCYTAQNVFHVVSTPSGGYDVQYSSRSCYTVYAGTDTSATPLSQNCAYLRSQSHYKDGGVQVIHYALGNVTTEAGETFCFSATYHEANGQIQYESFSYTAC